VPLLEGAKVKLAFLLAAAARVNGKVSPLTPNPEPVKLAEETVTDELPVLLSVTAWLPDCPTVTDPNETEVGEADKSTVTGALMITSARALDLGSATLVATTEAVPAVDGAVKRPLVETVPPPAATDQVTAVFVEPVTAAAN
jgi:hypothetical protein